jgi:hypothetical protein
VHHRDTLMMMRGVRAAAVLGAATCVGLVVACDVLVGLGTPYGPPDTGLDSPEPCTDRTPDETAGLFVAASNAPPFTTICPGDGSDAGATNGACTKAAPCASIAEAICALAAKPTKSTIYVAAGSYRGSVTLRSFDRAIAIQAGWNAGFDRFCNPGSQMQRASIVGDDGAPAVDIEQFRSVAIDNLDVTSGAPLGVAASSYGIFAVDTRNSGATLTLEDVSATSQTGTTGADGDAGAPGSPGIGTCAGNPALDAGESAPAADAGAPGAPGSIGTFGATGYVSAWAGAGGRGDDGVQGGAGFPGECGCTCASTIQYTDSGVAGCGGQGGSGGTPGLGGGGSFALYAFGVTVNAQFGAFRAAAGASGGAGGPGGLGGNGTRGKNGDPLTWIAKTCANGPCTAIVVNNCAPYTFKGGDAGGDGGRGGAGGVGGSGSVGPSCSILAAGSAKVMLGGARCAYVPTNGGPDNLCNGRSGSGMDFACGK